LGQTWDRINEFFGLFEKHSPLTTMAGLGLGLVLNNVTQHADLVNLNLNDIPVLHP
jgi:hypothetical protein